MRESLSDAKEELKRVDHLIYVSLKYTRTVDVFKNIITRLISSIDFALEALLKQLKENKKISEVPTQAGFKCNVIKEHITDEKILKLVDFYVLLRQINRAEFKRAREYRRHVTMTIVVNGSPMDINIDEITAYYKRVKDDVEYIQKLAGGEAE